MDIHLLVKVTSRAWALTILARMHQGTPGRQAALLHGTGAGRTAFAQSLTHLLDLGLMERNPGHGHPLRPEYRLTPLGMQVATVADQIERATPQISLVRRAWTVPVLAVSQTPRYFGQIKTALGPITDRALSQTLRQLQNEKWVIRDIDVKAAPPRALYRAQGAGLQISEAVQV